MNALQPTKFQMALYTSEPEESDLTRHEFEGEWYWRMKPAIQMRVDPEAEGLKFVITFTAAWNRLEGFAEYMALIGDDKLLRAKKISCFFESHAIYDLSYDLGVGVENA